MEYKYRDINIRDIQLKETYPFTFTAWHMNCKTMIKLVEHLHKNGYSYVRTKSFSSFNLNFYLHFVKTQKNKIGEPDLYAGDYCDGDLIDELKARLALEKESSVIMYNS